MHQSTSPRTSACAAPLSLHLPSLSLFLLLPYLHPFHPSPSILSPCSSLTPSPPPLPLFPLQRQPAAARWRPGAGWWQPASGGGGMGAGRGLAVACRRRQDGGRARASGMEDGRRRPGAGRRDGGRSPAASPSPPPDPAGGEAAGWRTTGGGLAWDGGMEAGCRRPRPPLPQIRSEGKRRDGWPAGGGMGGRPVDKCLNDLKRIDVGRLEEHLKSIYDARVEIGLDGFRWSRDMFLAISSSIFIGAMWGAYGPYRKAFFRLVGIGNRPDEQSPGSSSKPR
uniref:Uncharacterized protein n=1 Tax=Oryza sativa subsp. japonica TaxID=39947 RepID=Q8H2P3_ORYSJ|nr:hypothetical protein [Oryza sativa Japonica Group]